MTEPDWIYCSFTGDDGNHYTVRFAGVEQMARWMVAIMYGTDNE
jgi:hypothetical protein